MAKNFEQSTTIIVNGVTMSLNDYRKLNKVKTTKIAKTTPNDEIRSIPNELDCIMKDVGVIKSLMVFYTNGTKQWGNKVQEYVLDLPEIKYAFAKFYLRTKELNSVMEEIKKLSRRGSKSVYQYIEIYGYRLDDVKTEMENLYNGVKASYVIDHFKNYEFINGNGKRLGLKTLMFRTARALMKMKHVLKQIDDLSQSL